jgi:hypothetical protein
MVAVVTNQVDQTWTQIITTGLNSLATAGNALSAAITTDGMSRQTLKANRREKRLIMVAWFSSSAKNLSGNRPNLGGIKFFFQKDTVFI